jgi:hypothetical protein
VFNQGLLKGKDEQNLEILNQFILIVMQVYHHDQDSDPSELYRVLCEDAAFTIAYEQCDTHELNVNL